MLSTIPGASALGSRHPWRLPTGRAVAGRALAAAFILVVVLVGLGARPAHGHADLLATDPPVGSPLPQLPEELVLFFSAPVDLAGASVRVVDASGADVTGGELAHRADDPTSVVIPVGAAAPGPVSVLWTLLGDDGHAMTGMAGYTVTGAGAVSAADPAAPPVAVDPVPAAASAASASARVEVSERLASVGRVLTYAALVLLVGLAAFHLAIWPAGATTRPARVLHAGGVLAGVTGATLGMASVAVALGAADGWGAGLERAIASGPGRASLAQLAVAPLAGVAIATVLRRGWSARAAGRGVVVVAAAALLWCQGRAGHSWATGGYAVAFHLIHVGAMAVWLGGLVGLLVVAVPAWSSRGALREEFGRRMASFSQLAAWSVFALVWSGGALLLGEWVGRGGLARGYWTVLVVKLLTVGGALLAAFATHRWVRRGAVIGRGSRPPRVATPALARRVATELGLTVSVLAVTSILAGVSPAP